MFKLILALVLSCINTSYAADIGLHHVSEAPAQTIMPHPQHAEQYSLSLSPLLWQLAPDQPVVLHNDGKDLVAIYRRENSAALFVQVLPHVDAEPIHLHLYGSHVERYRQLVIHTDGRLSLYAGLYASIDAHARTIFLNEDGRDKNAVHKRMRVGGNLSLVSAHAFVQRADVKISGQSFVKSIDMKLHAPFGSMEQSSLHAASMTINKSARVFSANELKLFADDLDVHGFIKAPLVNLVVKRQAQWHDPSSTKHDPQIRAHVLGLLADTMVFANTQLEIKHGMWAKGKIATGLASFTIGGSQRWHFPKISKRLVLPDMHGCSFDVTSIMFDSKTKFKIASGATTVNAAYAKIGDIVNGIYNRYKVHLDVKNHLSIDGMLSALTVEMDGLRAAIPGKLFATRLRSHVDNLDVSGVVFATTLSTRGSHFAIAKTGVVNTQHHDFSHNNIYVAGQLSATTAQGRSKQFTVAQNGNVALSTANLVLNNTAVSGAFAASHLSIAGDNFSVSSSGNITATNVNNLVPTWSLNGGGHIDSFTSAIPNLSLSSSSTFAIDADGGGEKS